MYGPKVRAFDRKQMHKKSKAFPPMHELIHFGFMFAL